MQSSVHGTELNNVGRSTHIPDVDSDLGAPKWRSRHERIQVGGDASPRARQVVVPHSRIWLGLAPWRTLQADLTCKQPREHMCNTAVLFV